MTGVNTFLESSTIHGLSYIAQTRKFAKLFWISVVLSGFITYSTVHILALLTIIQLHKDGIHTNILPD